MLNEQEKTKAEESVRIIMKAAMVKIFTVDPCGEDALQRMEQTAESIRKTFGLDGKIMDEYRSKVAHPSCIMQRLNRYGMSSMRCAAVWMTRKRL